MVTLLPELLKLLLLPLQFREELVPAVDLPGLAAPGVQVGDLRLQGRPALGANEPAIDVTPVRVPEGHLGADGVPCLVEGLTREGERVDAVGGLQAPPDHVGPPVGLAAEHEPVGVGCRYGPDRPRGLCVPLQVQPHHHDLVDGLPVRKAQGRGLDGIGPP